MLFDGLAAEARRRRCFRAAGVLCHDAVEGRLRAGTALPAAYNVQAMTRLQNGAVGPMCFPAMTCAKN